MEDQLLLEDLELNEAIDQLKSDDIITINDKLRDAVSPIVDSAAERGVDNLNVIYVDSPPQTDAFSYARILVDELGGTVVIRWPQNVAVASEDFSRAAITQAETAMMDNAQDYPLGLNLMLDTLTGYSVPWTIYSLIVGGVIIAVFVALIALWWTKGAANAVERATQPN